MRHFLHISRIYSSFQFFSARYVFREDEPRSSSTRANVQTSLMPKIEQLVQNPHQIRAVIQNHNPELLGVLDYYTDARQAPMVLAIAILFHEKYGKILDRTSARAMLNWLFRNDIPKVSQDNLELYEDIAQACKTRFPRTFTHVAQLPSPSRKPAVPEVQEDSSLRSIVSDIHGKALEQFKAHGDSVSEALRRQEIEKIQEFFPGIIDGKPVALHREHRITLLVLGRIAKKMRVQLREEDVVGIIAFCAGKTFANGMNPEKQKLYQAVKDMLLIFQKSLEALPKEWPKNKDGHPRTSIVDRRKISKAIVRQYVEIKEATETKERPTIFIDNLQEVLDVVKRDPRIKVVSFDLMDTLVEWMVKPGNRSNLLDKRMAGLVNQQLGLSLSKHAAHELYAKYHELNRKKGWSERKDFKVSDLFKGMVEEIIRENNVTISSRRAAALAEGLEKVTYATQTESMISTPRAKQTLIALKKKGIKIAVYSNTTFSKTFVEQSLAKAGLLPYVDQIFASSETGDLKSESSNRAYAHIRNWQPGLKVNQFLHVGDQEKADFIGPTNFGMQARCYKNPLGLKNLRDHSTNSPEYAKAQYDNLVSRVDMDAQDYMERNIPAKDLTPDVRKAAQQAYDITRNIYGPAVMYFCKSVIEQLLQDPKRLVICLGRDSFSMLVILKRLIAMTPGLSEKIDHKRIQFAAISRKLMNKAGNDADITYPNKKKLSPAEYQGYSKKFDAYLRQLGFHDYEHITVLDSGNTGTAQTVLQNLYPKKDISGRYLYLNRKSEDHTAPQKTGYFFQRDPNPGQTHGNSVFLTLESVHFFEDFFNGIFRSNTDLATRNGSVFPYESDEKKLPSRKLTPIEGAIVDPTTLPKDFQKFSVYHLMKKMVIKGLLDRAQLEVIQGQIDPRRKHHLDATEAEAKQKLGDYLEAFIAKRKSGIRDPREPLFDLLIRHGREADVSPEWIRAWKKIGIDEGWPM